MAKIVVEFTRPRLRQSVTWPLDDELPRWLVTVEFRRVAGRYECVDWSVRAFDLHPEAPIVTAEVRGLPIQRIVNIARMGLDPQQALPTRHALHDQGVADDRITWDDLVTPDGGRRRGPGRPPLSAAFLRRVATTFEDAVRKGKPPVKAVMDAEEQQRGWEVPKGVAMRWVRQARDAGVLTIPPSRAGQKRS